MKKMTGFATKVVTLLLAAALVLGSSGVKAYAATTDSPEYIDQLIDMVFSVKKPTITNNDSTLNGNGFDGKLVKDYYQIHTDITKTGDDKERYAVAVSGPAVAAAIDNVLNTYTGTNNYNGTHNINENDKLSGNGDQSVLAEEVLKAVLGEADYNAINVLADTYIRAQLGIDAEANAIVAIDWYVVKHQDDHRVGGRYHVDGNVAITFYDEWTVVYNFQKEYDSTEYESKALNDKIRVDKGATPVFPGTNNVILAPSAVDAKYDDAKYTLKVTEDGIADINFTGDKTIEIYYDVAEPEIKYFDWTVTYTFVNGEESNSITLDDKIENIAEDARPEFGANDIKAPNDVDNDLKNEDWALKTENNVPVITFHDGDHDIEITYVKVEKQPEQPGDPVNPNNPSDDPVNPQNPSDEPVDPQNPSEDPKDEPKQNDEPKTPIIPIIFADDPEEEPVVEEIPVEEPKTPEAAPEEEEIPVEEPGTPEGAPVEEEPEEEIPVEVPVTPEGAPEEEEIPVDIPATPEGDVLPQTGVASAAVFFGFGAGFIAIGAAVIGKLGRKEEI